SSKVCAVIANYNPGENQIEILGSAEEECSGIKHGVVVNIENTSKAINRAIENAEKESQIKVKDVIVNINGHHIEGHRHQAAATIPRTDREITSEDVDRVISSARAVPLSSDRQIIHAIPLDFKVDNQGGVEYPVGMEGNHLEVDVMLITGYGAPISNLDKCITRSGLGIKSSVAAGLAPSQTVVAKEEKDLGCLLVDIGAQTLNLAVFIGGSIDYISEVDIGADYITNDLAFGLRTSFSEAKKIKETYGSAISDSSLETEIKYMGVDGQTSSTTSTKEVNSIIEPRVADFIDYISDEISKSGQKDLLPGGIILSGGGAELKGIDAAIKNKLNEYQVRIGRPRYIAGKVENTNSPRFATAVGLIEYVINADKTLGMQGSMNQRGGFFAKLKSVFEEMF
ncbi:cell division protein FtsA, partial [Elusimicrobiota bacterium]